MSEHVRQLMDCLGDRSLRGSGVIPWGAPVPAFGNRAKARVATLGINPSNREFVNDCGHELTGSERRFHTLKSLGISKWSDASELHCDLVEESCSEYFSRNPYDRWFKPLDFVISGDGDSYYGDGSACHLDLIPYATSRKWTSLTSSQRKILLASSSHTLATLLRDSQIETLILNGRSVVGQFEQISGSLLTRRKIPSWSLPRQKGPGVFGFAYRGSISSLAGQKLGRSILVLGYNHNIQSSFGVTKEVMSSIRGWIARRIRGVNG